jgi:hypothetical protein
MQESEIVAKRRDLRRFSDQPVAEIVQCGEPIHSGSFRTHAGTTGGIPQEGHAKGTYKSKIKIPALCKVSTSSASTLPSFSDD